MKRFEMFFILVLFWQVDCVFGFSSRKRESNGAKIFFQQYVFSNES